MSHFDPDGEPGGELTARPGAGEPPFATPPQAVIFDFDGVILETAAIKSEAFAALFADRPEHLPRILELHREHLGVSRYVKFGWIYAEIFGEKLADGEARRLGESFSERVLARALDAPEVAGARRVLETLSGRIPAFVASGTPQAELEAIVERRDLGRCFREIHGSPPDKETIIRDILGRYGFAPGRVVLVGDGLSDYRAARATGLAFIARISSDSRFGERPLTRIDDLLELPTLLNL